MRIATASILFVVIGSGVAFAAPVRVRGVAARTAGGPAASAPLLLGTSSVPGALLVLAIQDNHPSSAVVSITDNEGNTYEQAIAPVRWHSGALRTQLWYVRSAV